MTIGQHYFETMTAIRTFLVTAKHWQLFPVFAAMFFLPFYVSSKFSAHSVARILTFSASILLLVAWYWSIASFLENTAHKRKSRLLPFACTYAIVYVPTSLVLLPNEEPSFASISFWLSLAYILCIFYTLAYISVSLATVEMGVAKFRFVYLAVFILLFFSPLAVWVIQPRINRLVAHAERGMLSA
jgi:hypothetical protein